uniref:hypothetical protein n=1 Tax=Pseudomonas profundi TaxID=1981513 RepID=UPI00123A66C8
MPEPLDRLGYSLCAEILKKTGIPVGVGIATTKTLSKLANAAAKCWQNQTGGVVDICDPGKRDNLLKVMPVGEVWGIGRMLNEQLHEMDIKTAWDLAKSDTALLRKRFSVLEKKQRESWPGSVVLIWSLTPHQKRRFVRVVHLAADFMSLLNFRRRLQVT